MSDLARDFLGSHDVGACAQNIGDDDVTNVHWRGYHHVSQMLHHLKHRPFGDRGVRFHAHQGKVAVVNPDCGGHRSPGIKDFTANIVPRQLALRVVGILQLCLIPLGVHLTTGWTDHTGELALHASSSTVSSRPIFWNRSALTRNLIIDEGASTFSFILLTVWPSLLKTTWRSWSGATTRIEKSTASVPLMYCGTT